MAVAMAGFTMNDSITKAVSLEMNFGQVMLVRGLFATVLIAALAYHRGALRSPRATPSSWRSLALRARSPACRQKRKAPAGGDLRTGA